MNIATMLKEVSKLTITVNDGIDHLPLSIITATIADLKLYLGQVLQYYREFSVDEINLISFKKDSTQLEVVVDSESKMIWLLLWIAVYNRKNIDIDNWKNRITISLNDFMLDYDILNLISMYIIREGMSIELINMIDNITLSTK